jgi:hypothetical protein
MPFAAPTDFSDDPNDPKKSQNGVNISGQSTTFATNVPGQETTSGGKQAGSGQYANIQSYLDANKQQADEMGQKISTNVANQAEDATSKINNFQSQAPKIDAYDPNAAIGNVTNLTDADKAQYQDEKKTGGYTGPQTVDQVNGYQDAQKAASTAATNVTNAGTETGQQQLLKDTYNRPQYSAGENKLDQALLQNSAGSRSSLENLANKYSGIDQMFNTAATNVGDAVNGATAQALANKQAFIPAEQNAVKSLVDPIQARADAANQSNGSYIDQITAAANDNVLSDDTLKALGLTSGQKLFDLNLDNYITPDRTQVGINNAATADERNKYAALSALFDNPTMTQITSDGKTINPVSFDNQKFTSDLAGKQQAYDDAYTNQRGTVLDPTALPEFQGNYASQIPGALTNRRDINNATPKELESYWLPIFQKAASNWVSERGAAGSNPYQIVANAIQQSVGNWNNKYQPNRQVVSQNQVRQVGKE